MSHGLLIFRILCWRWTFIQYCIILVFVMQCNLYLRWLPFDVTSAPPSFSSRFFYFVHTLFCIYCIWWLQWSAIKPGELGTERCPPPHKQHSHRNRYRWVFTIICTVLWPDLLKNNFRSLKLLFSVFDFHSDESEFHGFKRFLESYMVYLHQNWSLFYWKIKLSCIDFYGTVYLPGHSRTDSFSPGDLR